MSMDIDAFTDNKKNDDSGTVVGGEAKYSQLVTLR